MLLPHFFDELSDDVKRGNEERIKTTVRKIHFSMNPHPAGQLKYNVPTLNGKKLKGIQHKYHETVLVFPKRGQSCHAYCTFCFRWPQFTGYSELKMGLSDVNILLEYLRYHPEVTDLLYTGGDPLVMKASTLEKFILPVLEADLPGLQNIRIGSRVLTYWPYRFLTDNDSKELLHLFTRIVRSGKHLAFMAHFNHPKELETEEVQEAIARIRETGAEIRTQSPLLRNINDDPDLWIQMWHKQVELGCIPYYMFVVRDTGAQHYFGVPLVEAYEIFKEAFKGVSGLARTVRGPSMSATPGKIMVTGTPEIRGEKVISLTMIQARNPDWVLKPFFAEYDKSAYWVDDLTPAFGKEYFFFEKPEMEFEYFIKNLFG
jgi:KamA family protein